MRRVRRPPRARVPRRAGPDRAAVLHQLGVASSWKRSKWLSRRQRSAPAASGASRRRSAGSTASHGDRGSATRAASVDNPTYEQVCYDKTGHAEVVEVTYDAEKVPVRAAARGFWAEHDPTQLNRQGPTSARSTARSSSSTTRAARRGRSLARAVRRASRPVVTRSRTRRRSGRPRTTTAYLEKRGSRAVTSRWRR